MSSIFTKIISGEIPSYKIAENEDFYVFLDINPNAKGHTLVVPKKEVNRLFDLDEELYNGLMSYSRKIAKSIKEVIPCERIGMAVIGLEVPHVHVHLIPLQKMEDIQFIKKVKLLPEEFETTAKAIAEAEKKSPKTESNARKFEKDKLALEQEYRYKLAEFNADQDKRESVQAAKKLILLKKDFDRKEAKSLTK